MEGEALYLSCLPVIDEVTAQICRRHRLSADESEDFRSEVRLHFTQPDFDPLRRFEGRSSLRTYLIVVISRVFLDFRNRLSGRCRPSTDQNVWDRRLFRSNRWSPTMGGGPIRF
jgi:hypothetical protein